MRGSSPDSEPREHREPEQQAEADADRDAREGAHSSNSRRVRTWRLREEPCMISAAVSSALRRLMISFIFTTTFLDSDSGPQ